MIYPILHHNWSKRFQYGQMVICSNDDQTKRLMFSAFFTYFYPHIFLDTYLNHYFYLINKIDWKDIFNWAFFNLKKISIIFFGSAKKKLRPNCSLIIHAALDFSRSPIVRVGQITGGLSRGFARTWSCWVSYYA